MKFWKLFCVWCAVLIIVIFLSFFRNIFTDHLEAKRKEKLFEIENLNNFLTAKRERLVSELGAVVASRTGVFVPVFLWCVLVEPSEWVCGRVSRRFISFRRVENCYFLFGENRVSGLCGGFTLKRIEISNWKRAYPLKTNKPKKYIYFLTIEIEISKKKK